MRIHFPSLSFFSFSTSTQRTVQLEPYKQWPLSPPLFFYFLFFYRRKGEKRKRKRKRKENTLISKQGTEATLLSLYFKWLGSNLTETQKQRNRENTEKLIDRH